MTRTLRRFGSQILVVVAMTIQAMAADRPGILPDAGSSQEMLQLKAQLADQQRQIQELRAALQEQKKRIDSTPQVVSGDSGAPAPGIRRLGEVASTTPVVPAATAPVALPMPAKAGGAQDASMQESPLQLHIGSATITPVGFMDFTAVLRSTNPGSGIGTNFGSVPYNSAVDGNLGEFRLSAQNSRVGFRVDAKVHGANVLGYLESDFLGFVPANAAVSSNSDSLRLRLYWVDVRKGKIELFAGQSWSMLTPNRRGLSALPGDLFYSQNIDVNYQAGLVWSRNPQFRFIVHPTYKIAMGVSLESPEQYIGGSGGGGVVTLPAALATPYASQLNNGTTTLATPNAHPDIIAKVAFDPVNRIHVEIAGLFRTFKVYDPLNTTHYTAHGEGGSVNLNFALTKKLRIYTNNFYSDGGGR